MLDQIKDSLFGTLLLALWLILLLHSLLTFVYKVWFRASDFEKEIHARKERVPNWLSFFVNLTTTSVDLWIARLVSIAGIVSAILILVVLITEFSK